jgi:protein-export membrane protein SecD
MSDSRQTSFATTKRRAGWLLVLFLVAGAIAYPRPLNWTLGKVSQFVGSTLPTINLPFVLGLDLEGGTRLEYEADVARIDAADRREALNGVRDVIERRVNALGVSEPLIQTTQAGSAWRVIVELAGIKDVTQAIKLIGETPILEFKEVNTEPARELTAEERQQIATQNQQARDRATNILNEAKKPNVDFATLAAQSDIEGLSAIQGDLGYLLEKPAYASATDTTTLVPRLAESDLYKTVSQTAAGSIYPEVIERGNSYTVAKIEESQDLGRKEVKARHILISYANSQAPGLSTLSQTEARAKIDELKTKVTPQNFIELAKQNSQEPGAAESGGDLGWFGPGEMVPAFEGTVFTQATGTISDVVESPFGYHLIYKEGERPQKNVRVRVAEFKKLTAEDILPPQSQWKATKLTGKQLSSAKLEFDQQTGAVQVALQFDDEGSQLFADITRRNAGKPVAIFLDGVSISEPVVQGEIIGGRAAISGSYSVNDAKLLARRLQAGALPVPIKLIAQQTVGPTLGADSLDRSLHAGLVGFVLVAIFMIALYRLPGVVSIVALIFYAVLLSAAFKLIPVTLTLAGIAGFILSLGIALDANVLAFERLKEEWRTGKGLREAMEEAFHRAWPSIRDGHVTVLISAIVLYGFSSSAIRGFALTLAIGTLLSLFTAVVSTRTLLRLLSHTPLRRFTWWFLKPRDVA